MVFFVFSEPPTVNLALMPRCVKFLHTICDWPKNLKRYQHLQIGFRNQKLCALMFALRAQATPL